MKRTTYKKHVNIQKDVISVSSMLQGMHNFITFLKIFKAGKIVLKNEVQGFVLTEAETGIDLFLVAMSNQKMNTAGVMMVGTALKKYSKRELLEKLPNNWKQNESIKILDRIV